MLVISERDGGYVVMMDAARAGGLWWARFRVSPDLRVSLLDARPLLPDAGLVR